MNKKITLIGFFQRGALWLVFCTALLLNARAQSTASRILPAEYSPGVSFKVTIEVTPAPGTIAYGLEDSVPSGWLVSNVTSGGAFDATNEKVKWGPFFDDSARSLSYEITPPAGATGTAAFVGIANFDGSIEIEIGGSSQTSASGDPGGTAPAITAQPQDLQVFLGESATFSASATGDGDLTYQWFRNDVQIEGATSATLVISAVTASDMADYSVQVSNPNGSIRSDAAALAVLASLRVQAASGGTVLAEPALAGYPPGSTVTLTATADAGFEFAGWSGDAAGMDNPLVLTMVANVDVTASFAPVAESFALEVTSDPNGAISLDPNQSEYTPGSTVQLTAVPEPGFVFAGWEGDVSGIDNPLTLTMDADVTVHARFVESPVTVFGYDTTDGDRVLGVVFSGPITNLEGGDPGIANFKLIGGTVEEVFLWEESPSSVFELQVSGHSGAEIELDVSGLIDAQGNPVLASGVKGPLSQLQAISIGGREGFAVPISAGGWWMQARGRDIHGQADEFHFLQKTHSGNFDVRVRVAELEGPHEWTKAGLMAREDLTAGSRNVAVVAAPQDGRNLIVTQVRPDSDGVSMRWPAPNEVGDPSFPNAWLRLRRTGDVFSAYHSSDGSVWYKFSEITIALSEQVHVGMVLTSHSETEDAFAAFEDFSITTADEPEVLSHPADATVHPGDLVRLEVEASSASAIYRWFKDGVLLEGETGPSLSFTAELELAGAYHAEVDVGDQTLTSGTAAVSVSTLPVIAGPVTRPETGHRYYLLGQSQWESAARAALELGGRLVTINDAAENQFVVETFGQQESVPRHLWIGLHDSDPELNASDRESRQSEFVWQSGEPVSFANWSPNEPNNAGTGEFFVHIWAPNFVRAGEWNDAGSTDEVGDFPLHGVVEVAAFTLTVNTRAGGTVAVDPDQPGYEAGTTVTLTATPDAGFEFTGWSGDATGMENPLLVTMDSDLSVTASFAPVAENFVLEVTSDANGTVSVNPKHPEYLAGSTVELTAVANSGFAFAGWEGDATGMQNPLTITMESNASIHARFLPAFSIATDVLGMGAVELTPEKSSYFAGETVTVTAIPAVGHVFVSWLGSSSSSEPVLTLVMDEDKDLIARFAPATYSVTVSVVGNGSVTRTPEKVEYGAGEQLMLEAVAEAGHEFVGWGGDAGGSENPLTLTVENDLAISAIFQSAGGSGPWSLTTTVEGKGTIEVTPELAEYQDGKLVILEARPEDGYAFTGWSGDATGQENPLVLRMKSDKNITAIFEDAAAPEIIIELPPGGISEKEIFDLTGSVTDSSEILQVQWERNGQPQGVLALAADGKFSVTGLRLSEGANEFRITASDQWGNEGTAVATVVWQPGQSLVLQNPPEQREGKRVEIPVILNSQGNVGGMTFVLRYDPDYLIDPQFSPSSAIGSGFPTVNTDLAGEVRVSFALPGSSLPADAQLIGTVSVRARSVPFSLPTQLDLEILNISDANGSTLSGTFTAVGGDVRILKRRIVGDNNNNDKYDVGDATILLRYAAGLIQQRSWDLTLNDINNNNQIDAGDAGLVLRTVVGLNAQPTPLNLGGSSVGRPITVFNGVELLRSAPRVRMGLTLMADDPAEAVVLRLDQSHAKAGEIITLQVELQNLETALSGASFKLNYPVEALRLKGATAYRAESVVPSSASVLWNISPDQNKLETQNGLVSFAASSADVWPSNEGVLAEFKFEVQPGAADAEDWQIAATAVEVTSDGYDHRALSDRTVHFSGQPAVEVTPPVFSLLGTRLAASGFVLSISGGAGGTFELQASPDLVNWVTISVIDGTDGTVEVTDSNAGSETNRFYRLREVVPGQ